METKKAKEEALKEKARELGRQAFLNGKKAMAARDDAMMAFFQSPEVKEVYPPFSSAPLFKAWNDGFMRANMAAPL